MERCSCCWSRCPRQRRKRRKTLAPPFFAPFSLPPVPPIGHIQLKTCWGGRLRKAACRGQHPANTEHSRKEWRTYLRAKCPGETRPLDILRTSIAPCFITHNLSFYFGHPYANPCSSWIPHFIQTTLHPESLLQTLFLTWIESWLTFSKKPIIHSLVQQRYSKWEFFQQ